MSPRKSIAECSHQYWDLGRCIDCFATQDQIDAAKTVPADLPRETPARETLKNWVVWDDRGGFFWRENAQGYTKDLTQAGLFTEAEAKKYASSDAEFRDPQGRRDKAFPLTAYGPRIKRLAAALEAAPSSPAPERGWQPMSSAPKDGTWLLVINARAVTPKPFFSSWNEKDGAWVNQRNMPWHEPPMTHWLTWPAPPAVHDGPRRADD